MSPDPLPGIDSPLPPVLTPSEENPALVRSLRQRPDSSVRSSVKTAIVIVGILLAGTTTGWGISRVTGGSAAGGGLKTTEDVAQAGVNVGDVVGVADEKAFRDEAEGVLVDGGIDGEGSHHLQREGGASQNVYLTSSIVDLSLFVGHKVKVWGETFSAQRAGWLMDVGRVKVLGINSPPPFEE